MGLKNGKYDFSREHSSTNANESLPSYPIDTNESFISRISKFDIKSLPKCTHQDVLTDPNATSLDNLSLVWLDLDVYRCPSNIDTEVKLKNLISYVRTFNQVEVCERYIKQIGRMNNVNVRKEYLLVIISTVLAPTLMPHLHDLPQVKCVYIYGKPKTISKAHQEWLKTYSKVRGVFNSSRSLIAQISQDLK
ncbi:unnamed protein product [Adineta ricciae]|uniref:Uncharacterized protein n=1 Tax=Adineta ricciae TaxID=249248 RepID=A0A813UAL8_ADIRI|nr:unnamed protein product [Adineta ricciae]CAF1173379.1 unnamed protein product [Adineta ricciae]